MARRRKAYRLAAAQRARSDARCLLARALKLFPDDLKNFSERELEAGACGSRRRRMRVDVLHATRGLAGQT